MTLNQFTLRPELFAIRRLDVEENGIGITFSSDLFELNGSLRDDKVCVLKLDEYQAYNSRQTKNPPKVIDNLIVLECCDGSLKLYLVELRHSRGRRPTQRLKYNEIEEKFKTAMHDFIEKRYSDIFHEKNVSEIKAFLVSDPWGHSERIGGRELFEKKAKSSALDAYGSKKPLRLLGRNIFINPVIPPDPLVEPC